MAKLLLSKEVNEKLNEEIVSEVARLSGEGIVPTLATIRVGDRGEDITYERSITKKFEKLGLAHKVFEFPENSSDEEIISSIEKINEDKNIHGILVFKPLPDHLDKDRIINTIDSSKDVDGVTNLSMAKIYKGDKDTFTPCTPEAVIRILKHYGVELTGKNVVVIGRSLVIGKPIGLMLITENATVTICHSKTRNLPEICRKADIIVTAAGVMKMVNESFVSPGQILIDVGIHVDDEGKMYGDIDFDSVESIVGAISPVPGGVGGVTTGMLALATIKASSRKENK